MAELKHVGRVIATGKKCLIAYRTLPGDAYSALVVPTENLPDSYHDALINLVESNAGQTSHEFAEALDRTQFPDGSRMLPALHAQGRLVKIPTDQVEVVPTNSTSIVLSELNQIIADSRGIPVDELSIKPADAEVKEVAKVKDLGEPSNVEDFSRTTSASINEGEVVQQVVQPTIDPSTDPVGAAKHYRSQADKLAKEAAQFRRMAEDLVPTAKKSTKVKD
jgi:hypothetical protein